MDSIVPVVVVSVVVGSLIALAVFGNYFRKRKFEVESITQPEAIQKASKPPQSTSKKSRSKPHSHAADKDGHPPLGWSDTLAYLVLPVLLVLSQYISIQIMQSSFTNNILSMAQQVFLQKSGVTKNSVSKFSDNIIKKEEQSQIQKSVFETSTIIKEPQVEKSTSEGLRPGERFKQLKEQEARRRQQRDEEKKKVEEAAANVTQTNGAHEKEAILVQGESGDEVESSDSKNGSPNSLTGRSSCYHRHCR